MQRRDHAEVLCSMLEAGLNGVNKTGIVYRSNINFDIVKQYLIDLMKAKLLETDGKLYQTTEKGVSFMRKYAELREMLVC